jgi:hypothetical protein
VAFAGGRHADRLDDALRVLGDAVTALLDRGAY